MNKSAKRYIDWAYEYQVAALTLYTQLVTAPHLYNPTIFLLRHTVELQLKGLIIGEIKRSSNTRIDDIKIGKRNRKLNQAHSLLELWEKYIAVVQGEIDTNEISRINRVIKKLNRKDPGSDRYRYPQSKRKQNFATEPIQLDFSGKAPDLAEGIPYVMIADGNPVIIEKGPHLLQDLNDIVEATELLFNLSER